MGTKDKSQKSTKILTGIIITLFILGAAGFAYAGKAMEDLEKQVEELSNKVDEQDSLINQQKEQIQSLTDENWNLNDQLQKQQGEHEEVIKQHEEAIEQKDNKIEGLEEDLQAKKAAEEKEKQLVQLASASSKDTLPSRGESSDVTELYMTATAYTAECAGCSGITATGINLNNDRDKKVIAVDPSVIPLGSKVWVEGYGYAIAGDTGGAIKGSKIDLHVPTKSEAFEWGVQKVRVKVYN